MHCRGCRAYCECICDPKAHQDHDGYVASVKVELDQRNVYKACHDSRQGSHASDILRMLLLRGPSNFISFTEQEVQRLDFCREEAFSSTFSACTEATLLAAIAVSNSGLRLLIGKPEAKHTSPTPCLGSSFLHISNETWRLTMAFLLSSACLCHRTLAFCINACSLSAIGKPHVLLYMLSERLSL